MSGKRLRRLAAGTFVASCVIVSSPVRAGAAATEQRAAGTAAKAEVAEGILPVPDYAGGWLERPALSGDWGGTRQKLANKGLTLGVDWTQIVQGVAAGGRETGWEYGGSFDYVVRADLMRAGLLPGALLTVRAESRYGDSVNPRTGSILPVNTDSVLPLTDHLDEDIGITVTELNYAQFLSSRFGLLVGKIQTMDGDPNEFAGGRGRYQFMNLSLVQSPVSFLTVPYSTLATGLIVLPTESITVSSIFMNRKDSSTTTGFDDIDDGTTWVTEGQFQHRLANLPGGGNIGVAYSFNGDFRKVGGLLTELLPPGKRGNRDNDSWALFTSAWQYLFARGERPAHIDVTDGRPDLEGIGVFARAGAADEDTNPLPWSVSIGVGGRGLVPRRGRDSFGIGYAYGEIQEPESLTIDGLVQDGQGFEAFYDLSITPAVDLTLDLQWTKGSLQRVDAATTLGWRLNVRL